MKFVGAMVMWCRRTNQFIRIWKPSIKACLDARAEAIAVDGGPSVPGESSQNMDTKSHLTLQGYQQNAHSNSTGYFVQIFVRSVSFWGENGWRMCNGHYVGPAITNSVDGRVQSIIFTEIMGYCAIGGPYLCQ